MRSAAITIFVAVIGSVAMSLSGSTHAYTGHVIDGITGKPAAGVFVIGRWETGGGFVVPSSGCVIAIAQSDEKGEFTLRGGDGFFGSLFGPNDRPAIMLYRHGYTRKPSPDPFEDPVVAVVDERSAKERLKFILDMEANTDCGSPEERKAKGMPLYRAILEEAKAIAKTADELPYVNGAMFKIDILELGYEQARARSAERRRNWGLK